MNRPLSRAELVSQYRVQALKIVQDALNHARSEIRQQIVTGRVNPVAVQGLGEEQGGFNPTLIDVEMNNFIARRVAAINPNVTYWSEEERKNLFPSEGDIFAWCDPLDGTMNSFTYFAGYAIVLFFERYTHGQFDHLAGAIASSDGSIVSWHHFAGETGEVFIDWPLDFVWPGSEGSVDLQDRPTERLAYSVQMKTTRYATPGIVPIYTGVDQRFAAVASKGKRRAELDRMFDLTTDSPEAAKDNPVVLSTLAGNPLIAPLLVGQLGAIIEPHSPTLHDAAYLIPLILSRGVVVDFDDQQVHVIEKFSEPDPAKRRIGPFIASAGEEAIRELLRRRKPVAPNMS